MVSFCRISQILEPTAAKQMKIDRCSQRRNCSPLNVLFSSVQITLISQGIPLSGGVKQECDGKTNYFRAKCIHIESSRRYVHSYYQWLIGSCICAFNWDQVIDDLGWPWTAVSSNFQRMSHICEATTTKQMKVDPYCQQQCCNPLNIFSTLCSLCWFAVDFFARGLHTRTAVARLP